MLVFLEGNVVGHRLSAWRVGGAWWRWAGDFDSGIAAGYFRVRMLGPVALSATGVPGGSARRSRCDLLISPPPIGREASSPWSSDGSSGGGAERLVLGRTVAPRLVVPVGVCVRRSVRSCCCSCCSSSPAVFAVLGGVERDPRVSRGTVVAASPSRFQRCRCHARAAVCCRVAHGDQRHE